MRLQDTYALTTHQIANGDIGGNFKSKILSGQFRSYVYLLQHFFLSSTARECYDLGRIAHHKDDFYHALMWMQEALDKLDDEVNNTTVNRIDILDHLSFATYKVKIFAEA